MEDKKETSYYIVFYGHDIERKANVTDQAIVTLAGNDIRTVDGIRTLTKMIEDDLKMERVCIINQIELSEIPAAGVFKL